MSHAVSIIPIFNADPGKEGGSMQKKRGSDKDEREKEIAVRGRKG